MVSTLRQSLEGLGNSGETQDVGPLYEFAVHTREYVDLGWRKLGKKATTPLEGDGCLERTGQASRAADSTTQT